MADTDAEYHHGEMNAATQVADYKVFLNFTKWFALHLGVLILMLVLWFCVGAGFLGGLVPGLIVLALGIWLMRAKPAKLH
jgi:thiamine transporter ThiT